MMETYLEKRENLLKVVQLVDIRHAPSVQDVQMPEILIHLHILHILRRPCRMCRCMSISGISGLTA